MLGKLLSEVFTVFTALTKTFSTYSTALSESLQYFFLKCYQELYSFLECTVRRSFTVLFFRSLPKTLLEILELPQFLLRRFEPHAAGHRWCQRRIPCTMASGAIYTPQWGLKKLIGKKIEQFSMPPATPWCDSLITPLLLIQLEPNKRQYPMLGIFYLWYRYKLRLCFSFSSRDLSCQSHAWGLLPMHSTISTIFSIECVVNRVSVTFMIK